MRLRILEVAFAIPFCLMSRNLSAQTSSAAGPLSGPQGGAPEVAISDLEGHADDAAAIRKMVAQGVMTTVSEGKFEPDAGMTRAEFAESIQRLFKLPPAKRTPQLPDVSSNTPATEAIQAVAPFMNRQIVCFTCALSKNFFPNEPITSDLAVVAVVGILRAQKKIELVSDEDANQVLSSLPEFRRSGPVAALYFATAVKLGLMPRPQRYSPAAKSTRADMAVLFDHVQGQVGVPLVKPETK